ncbi:MAG: hypothetical protein ABSH32_16995 [Bryobacteraceae bacterium]
MGERLAHLRPETRLQVHPGLVDGLSFANVHLVGEDVQRKTQMLIGELPALDGVLLQTNSLND